MVLPGLPLPLLLLGLLVLMLLLALLRLPLPLLMLLGLLSDKGRLGLGRKRACHQQRACKRPPQHA